jgi:hypothetical protein
MKSDPAYCWLEDKLPSTPIEEVYETPVIDMKPIEEEKIVGDIKTPVGEELPIEPLESVSASIADPVVIKDWIVALKTDSALAVDSKDGKIIKPTEVTAIGVAIQAEMDELVWETPEDALATVVNLHGQTMEGYKGSGLG